MMKNNIRAVGLISGGLDSVLACRLMMDQGIDVVFVYIEMPWGCGQKESVLALAKLYQKQVKIIPLEDDYLSILKKPKYGFGVARNPCVDCHIYMVQKAFDYMKEIKASFIFTGEVLGQRPMSQRRVCLEWVEKETKTEGLLLRPLSALSLKVTIPEEKGWVNRSQLLNITGRSRKGQYALAESLGLKVFSQPGGGCLLTEPHFAQRVQEVLVSGCEAIEDLRLLGVGRYQRWGHNTFALLGRDDRENQKLMAMALPSDMLFLPHSFLGPVALLRCRDDYDEQQKKDLIHQVGQWMLSYSKAKGTSHQQIINARTQEVIEI